MVAIILLIELFLLKKNFVSINERKSLNVKAILLLIEDFLLKINFALYKWEEIIKSDSNYPID